MTPRVLTLDDLVSPLARCMFHRHDHPAGAGDQIHGAPHPLDHFPGNHPVRQIAFAVDLQRAKDCQVNMAAADHGKGIGAAEVRSAGQFGDRFLPCVDQVGIHFGLTRIGPYAEHAVFRMKRDINARRDVVGHEGRHADAKVDIIAVLQLPRDAFDDAISYVHENIHDPSGAFVAFLQ